MTGLKMGTRAEPGSWRALLDSSRTRPISASVTCPKCLFIATLEDHEIGSDGTVSPSVVCPNEDCDWHETVRLVGWSP